MSEQDQIKAIAELDGKPTAGIYGGCVLSLNGKWVFTDSEHQIKMLPDYLHSYDAIIPVIQKQDRKIIVRLILSFKGRNDVARMFDWIQYKPAQLCEALLRATGKWKP